MVHKDDDINKGYNKSYIAITVFISLLILYVIVLEVIIHERFHNAKCVPILDADPKNYVYYAYSDSIRSSKEICKVVLLGDRYQLYYHKYLKLTLIFTV